MQARVHTGELQPEFFEVNVGVRQLHGTNTCKQCSPLLHNSIKIYLGCVLAPVLFNILPSAITCLFHCVMRHEDGVHVEYCLDGSLFNIRWLQAHTKTKIRQICELQYDDDCAILAHSPDTMQHYPQHNIQSVSILWPTG